MKLRMLRERALAELRANIEHNLEKYRSGNFDYLLTDPSLSFQSEVEIVGPEIAKLKDPVGSNYFEVDNSETILAALPNMTPYQAADERGWVMLSHTALLQHARARWPIPKNGEEAVRHISFHYFGRTQRQLERDNVGSRLWWMGHLCSRVEGMPLKKSLEILLHRSDVRANIVERPTTAQSVSVFAAIITRLEKSYKGKQKLFERTVFRNLMVRLNGLGGYKLLDALDRRAVEKLVDELITNELGIVSV